MNALNVSMNLTYPLFKKITNVKVKDFIFLVPIHINYAYLSYKHLLDTIKYWPHFTFNKN